MSKDRDKQHEIGETESFNLRDIRQATDSVRQRENEREKESARGTRPAPGLAPTNFPDRFLKMAERRLVGKQTLVDQFLFVHDVAEADSTMSFFVALELARRISIAPMRTGPEQELARRASAAIDAARQMLREKGEPGLLLVEVQKLADD